MLVQVTGGWCTTGAAGSEGPVGRLRGEMQANGIHAVQGSPFTMTCVVLLAVVMSDPLMLNSTVQL